MTDLRHDTLVFEQSFSVPCSRVFAAYADSRARERWSAPSPTAAVRIDRCELRAGGHEDARCGSAEAMPYRLHLEYHEVIDGQLITFTERLWDEERLMTVALISFSMTPTPGGGARLRVTDQVTSFVGEDGIAGHRAGYGQALTNLGAMLG